MLKFMSIHSLMLSNHFILCHPLLLLISIFPSIRVFSNELALRIRWPNDWSFSFSNRPSNEYSGLIFFRIDWFHLPAVQGTLKSLLQHHNLKASVLCIRWPNYWSFSFNIRPSNEYSGLISLRMYWLDLLAVQGLTRVFSKLQCSAFFIVQLSRPYMTTGKTIALNRWTLLAK